MKGLAAVLAYFLSIIAADAFVSHPGVARTQKISFLPDSIRWSSSSGASDEAPFAPSTFREAELIGLRLMQEGSFEEAINGAYDFML